MAACGVEDLPIELCHHITNHLARDKDGTLVVPGRRSHQLATLCLVSRYFYTCIVSLLYQDICVWGKRFTAFHASISSNQSLRELVKTYRFTWRSQAEDACSTDLSLSLDEKSGLVMELLRDTIQLLPSKLHTLQVGRWYDPLERDGDWVSEIWQIDLKSLTGLRNVYLNGFAFDIPALGALLGIKALEDIEIRDYFQIEAAQSTELSQQLSSMTIGKSEAQTPRLRRLCVNSQYPSYKKSLGPYLRTILSHMLYLRELDIESSMLWPNTNSWEERESLYEDLPPRVEILKIHFPIVWDFDHSYHMAFDGVFLQVSESNYDFVDSQIGYKQQDIPRNRYTWLTNLLKEHRGLTKNEQPYLTSLKTLQLEENRSHKSQDTEEWLEDGETKPMVETQFQLPCEIEAAFTARSIAVNVVVRDYWYVPS